MADASGDRLRSSVPTGTGRRAKNVLPSLDDPHAWYRQPLASLDFETTGIDPHRDRILSFAALSDVGGDLMGMVNPGVPIPESSADIHGITASDLAASPVSTQALRPILAWVDDLIYRKIGLVVYNASFDLTLLRAEAIRHRLDQPEWDELLVIDPFVIDWGVDRERRGQRRLGDVAAHYGVRSPRHKLIHYYGRALGTAGSIDRDTEPYWELFDLDEDPNELRNLYDAPEVADCQAALHAELDRLMTVYGDTPVD